MILVDCEVKVMKVEYGWGRAEIEIVSGKVKGDNIKVMTVCDPPRINMWLTHVHEEIINDMLDNMIYIKESCKHVEMAESCKNVVMVGDFNGEEVN